MKNVGSLIGAVLKPTLRPVCPYFGSGPTKKRPGWTPSALAAAVVGRSHRSNLGKIQLNYAIKKTKDILNLPSDYLCGIVPASDTGAFEMALWNLLGPKPVDSVYFESFGAGWHTDITKQLKLKNVIEHTAPYGQLPDLTKTNSNHDIVFTWNGTTSGVMVPNADWIDPNRSGLTLCDATSAVFSQPVDFKKCDVTTFSWQKVLGGEGAHGMLILSPRAVERIESYTPSHPLPKIFRLTKKGKLIKGIFEGETINTPSMLCVEDYIDALSWVEQQGGQAGIMEKTNENLAVLTQFVNNNPWMTFLAKDKLSRSNTSVCLQLNLSKPKIKEFTTLLEKEDVAFDIGSYRDAPSGLRIWCGATVNKEDLEALMPWLKWAYTQVA